VVRYDPFPARLRFVSGLSVGVDAVTSPAAEHICVVIGRTRHKMFQVEIQEAAKRGARMIELRLDFLAKAPDYKRLLQDKPCPVVATFRRPQDGGRWGGSEEERLMQLRQAIVAGIDWVDLESDIADKIRRFGEVRRIVSYHNMREVPEDLEIIHERMCRQDADVVKITVRAQDPADNLRVLKLMDKPATPTVAFCMGDMGIPSRILAARLGAPFAYAAFNRERNVAPGIPSFDEMVNVYHYEQVNAETQVYGVIGDPVGHSLSPLIHNTAFRHLGINAVYLPFRVPRGELERFLKEFDSLPVKGYSVTIPHKEAAAAAARHQDGPVAQTLAANTLVRGTDGFTAFNTDYSAAIDSLYANMPPAADGSPPTLNSRVVLLVGAGGVARAVAHALHREGALLTIVNRTPEKAHHLAEELSCRAVDWAARNSVACEIIVNCSSIGMHPNLDESPIHHSVLKPGLVVFDCVYTPETTLLVKEARARGCYVITGVDMFIRQAAQQFRLFTGQEPPIPVMEKTIRRSLSPIVVREDE
jgi:3-dehydroquinate dehydratase/shikimate dehydrogenase